MEHSIEGSFTRESPRFRRNWIGFFILGLTNTLPYAIASTAANTIADSFDKRQFVATIYGAGGSATIIVKAINTFFLTNVSYGSRILVNSALMLLGLAGVAYAKTFIVAIFAIVLVGAVNAFGENVALGYLARFDGQLVNAWSSGTGMAGLAGAAIYVLFGCLIETSNGKDEDLKTLDKWAFMLIMPAVIGYLIAFFQVIREPASTNPSHPPAALPVPAALPNTFYPSIQHNSKDTTPLLDNTAAIMQRTREGGEDAVIVQSPRWNKFVQGLPARLKRYRVCFQLVAFLAVNLGAAQFLAYVIRTAGAQARNGKEYDKGCPELYASLQLCFQAGVFTSRSSVQVLRIRKVYILNMIQAINMIVWIINQQYKFLPVSILPAYMIFVGLLSGAVYVNVFYTVQTDSKYRDERELCVNITAIFITVGISLSCILQTILFNTVSIPDSQPDGKW